MQVVAGEDSGGASRLPTKVVAVGGGPIDLQRRNLIKVRISGNANDLILKERSRKRETERTKQQWAIQFLRTFVSLANEREIEKEGNRKNFEEIVSLAKAYSRHNLSVSAVLRYMKKIEALLYSIRSRREGISRLRTNILQLLISIIRNSSAESMLRSREMMISGRLLSKENVLMFIDESGIKAVISAIDERLSLIDNSQDADECECGLEAMGQIGSCK